MKHAVLTFFLLMPLWAWAQTTITTRVVDAESGEPLPLVGVYVSEDNNTLTNFDGEFTLKYVDLSLKDTGVIWLVPANNSYPRIKITPERDFRIWGVVSYTIKKRINHI